VRTYLAALEAAGVVERRADPPAGRGRPSRRYRLAPDPGEQEALGHRELVRLLMGLVARAGFGADEVRSFGERQGRAIAVGGGGPDEIRAAFERLGFAPARSPGEPAELVLGRCPFADAVEAPGGELVCVLHRGLAEGIAAAAAPGTEVTDLEIADPRHGGCRFVLAPAVAVSPHGARPRRG
jgi:predicted ArsR family transcriptional regulator